LIAGHGGPADSAEQVRRVRDRVRARVVGRERELDLILAAVAAGRDLLLEGPPGTSKSTLLRAITAEWGIPLVFVEGNADLTPAKLVGHHNPARVLREDYSADTSSTGRCWRPCARVASCTSRSSTGRRRTRSTRC
jgi:MoxR-like ATPase